MNPWYGWGMIGTANPPKSQTLAIMGVSYCELAHGLAGALGAFQD